MLIKFLAVVNVGNQGYSHLLLLHSLTTDGWWEALFVQQQH